MASQAPPCVYYLKGYCARGASCGFSHEKPSPEDEAPQGPVCEFFKRGRCRFGDQCRFYHPIKNTLRLPLEPPSMPMVPERFTTSISSINPSFTTAKGTFIPCKFYAQGRCIKGDACPSSHPLPGNVVNTQAFGPCKFFRRGQCTMGDLCSFEHSVDIGFVPPETVPTTTTLWRKAFDVTSEVLRTSSQFAKTASREFQTNHVLPVSIP